jgi:putative nucleotidyltransferase with HDIG domain
VRLTPTSRAVGLPLARDLPATGPGRVPLLRAGTILTHSYVRSLDDLGIYAVWVHDELSEGIDPVELMPAGVRAETAHQVQDALTAARDAFASQQPLADDVVRDLRGVADTIARTIVDSPAAALALTDLAAADGYTHRHSVNVTALGLLIARTMWRREGWVDWRGQRRFDRIDEMLAKIGLGLLLHDIGKMAIPTEVLNKPGALTEDEWELMRTHPETGAEMLKSDTISPLVRSVVREHHERWDGGGYPAGLAGAEISDFARIAAVADVYDAMTSNRPYKRASPPHEAVQVILDGDGSAFDPDVVAMFRRVIFPYPVGTEVTLPDGRVGVVADLDPEEPTTIVVRVEAPGGAQQLLVDMRETAIHAR